MARCSGGSLLDNEIMQELHPDPLSDAPSDCESDKSSYDDDYDFGSSKAHKDRKRERLEVSDPDVNIDDNDDDDDDDEEEEEDDDDDCWTNNDNLKNLEQFLGDTALTFTPNDPITVSEVVKLSWE
jgi:hypothetical protein